jgi:hypothetical protein
MAEIKENDEIDAVQNVENIEVWKSYPEFSNYLFSNTERVMKGDKEIKVRSNAYDRKIATLFDDTGKARGMNVSYICEILFPKKQFKQYQNYSNYLIYEDGTILNKASKIVLRVFEPKIVKRKRVRLINDQGVKLELDLAHIVGELFLENPNNYKFIKHLDSNVLNNNYKNLQWVHSLLEKPYEEIEGEEWRDIKDMEDYQVSNKGRVKNKHNNFLMKESDHFGYTRVGIGTNKYYVHRLVAFAFIPNPENKPSVDHINRNAKDNILENLRWATSKEQSANQTITNGGCYKKINKIDLKTNEIIQEYRDIHEVIEYIMSTTTESDKISIENKIRACCTNRKENAYGFKWKYIEDLTIIEDEIWKKVTEIFPDAEDYLISNKGRVKNKAGKISNGRITHGYNEVYIGKGVSRKFIHTLVAKLFIPNPENKPIINHRDGDKCHNDVINLEWNTYSENSQHAFDTSLNGHGIKVKVTNTLTKEEKIYPTKVNACKDLKVEIKTFNRYLKDNKSYKNMLFEIV